MLAHSSNSNWIGKCHHRYRPSLIPSHPFARLREGHLVTLFQFLGQGSTVQTLVTNITNLMCPDNMSDH